MIENALVLSRA